MDGITFWTAVGVVTPIGAELARRFAVKPIMRGVKRVDEALTTLAIMGARVDRVFDLMERPLYETDGEGNLTRPNESFCKTLGLAPAQLIGKGWVTLLADADKERVMRETDRALKDKRAYRVRGVFEPPASNALEVLMVAEPKFEAGTGDILAYFGALEVLRVIGAKTA
jgi:PAS domain-containing protein